MSARAHRSDTRPAAGLKCSRGSFEPNHGRSYGERSFQWLIISVWDAHTPFVSGSLAGEGEGREGRTALRHPRKIACPSSKRVRTRIAIVDFELRMFMGINIITASFFWVEEDARDKAQDKRALSFVRREDASNLEAVRVEYHGRAWSPPRSGYGHQGRCWS